MADAELVASTTPVIPPTMSPYIGLFSPWPRAVTKIRVIAYFVSITDVPLALSQVTCLSMRKNAIC